MKAKIEKFWRGMSTAQAAVLVAIVVTTGWLLSRVPVDKWESLASQDPTETGGRIALFVLAVVAVFTKGKA